MSLHSLVVQEKELSQWEVLDFFLEVDFLQESVKHLKI